MPELRFGKHYVLRTTQREFLVDGRAVSLGGRAFDVLCMLAERAGDTVSRRELMDRVWPDSVVEENNLQVQISALRHILGPAAIVTVARRGYRLTFAADSEASLLSSVPPANSAVPGSAEPLPPLSVASQAPDLLLLEREEPLRELAMALAQARSGQGSVCLICGEAGIGKTALCEAFIAGLDVRVLRGGCEDSFSPRPLGPLHDFATELDPGLAPLLHQEGERADVFARTLGSLRTQATVLWLDDLHWADAATLDFVKYVGRRIQKCPVLLLLTYADDELSKSHPLRLVLGHLQGPVTRIKLAPLSELAVEKLARDAGRSAEGILAATGGNPFEVTELLSTKTSGLPEAVRDAVLNRLAKQRPEVQSLLELVAIVPGRLEHWIIQDLLDCDAATISEALSSGLLLSDGAAMAFRHELDRQAVEQSIASHRAQRLHTRVLALLTANPEQNIAPARYLHHARAAGLKSEVLRYAPLAAYEASQQGAHREAAAICRAALEKSDGSMPEQHAELLEIHSVERSRYETNPETACADLGVALEFWRKQGHALAEGRLLRRLARMHWLIGDGIEAEQYAQASVQRLESHSESTEYRRALGDQALTLLLTTKFHDAVEVGSKVLGLADRFGDERARCIGLLAIGGAEVAVGNAQGGFPKLEEALALALKRQFVIETAISYVNLVRALFNARDYKQLERRCREGISFLALGKDLDVFANRLRAIQSVAYYERGNWSDAHAIAQAVAKQTSNGPWRWLAQTVLILVQVGRGEVGGGEQLEGTVEATTRSRELLQMGGLVLAAQAQVQWLRGGQMENLAGLRLGFSWAKQAHFQRYIQELGYWLSRAGEQGVDGVDPASPRGLQMAGLSREAASAWHQLGCPLEEAQSLLQGDACAHEQAREIFVRLGANGWLARSGDFSARAPLEPRI